MSLLEKLWYYCPRPVKRGARNVAYSKLFGERDLKAILIVLVFSCLIILAGIAVAFGPWALHPSEITAKIDSSFRSVWNNTVGTKGGYYVVSDHVFPLRVYILDLPYVGNYRFSNHSDLINGIRRAVEISSGQSQVKEFKFNLEPWGEVVAKLNVNVSCMMVEDWTAYRRVIESESNAIVVNTYDEFLPVPDGYLKEAWADRIADFMLNRWGTWVHVGGYPFYRVWFQNGTQSIWGEAGFQELMAHIGKGNAICYPPNADAFYPSVSVMSDFDYGFRLIPDSWALYSLSGNPLIFDDFGDLNLFPLFTSGFVSGGAFHGAVRFSPTTTSFNFGVYVHLGTWKFRDYTYGESNYPAAFAGFLSTAVAILQDYSSLKKLYGREGDSASEVILKAQNEGRTVGLNQSLAYFQNALDAYDKGEYKTAASYADISIVAAQGAKTPTISYVPTILSILVASMLVTGTSVLYSRLKRREARNPFSKT